MSRDVRFNSAALEAMIAGADGRRYFKKAADKIRDRARVNAAQIQPGNEDAIVSEVAVDEKGLYADIGYDKRNPGFVLWWAEVGTRNQPAQPHLRPALKPGD